MCASVYGDIQSLGRRVKRKNIYKTGKRKIFKKIQGLEDEWKKY